MIYLVTFSIDWAPNGLAFWAITTLQSDPDAIAVYLQRHYGALTKIRSITLIDCFDGSKGIDSNGRTIPEINRDLHS